MYSIFPTHAIAYTLLVGGGPGVRLSGITNALPNDPPAFVTNVDFTDKDVTLPIVALDDKRVIYSFGKGFGEAHISGIIFIFGCDSVTSAVSQLSHAFNSNRISKKLSPCNLSIIGMSGTKVYPVALKFHDADTKVQSLMFTISCIVAPVANK